MRTMRAWPAVSVLGACALAGGCGGGQRQDAGAPEGTFDLKVVDASFPERQTVADASRLVISVRNADDRAVPDVAVTIATGVRGGGSTGEADQAFASDVDSPGVADASRPIWVVDDGPLGGDTAYVDTWALGRLEPGQTRRFVWRLTAVRPGDYTVGYTVSPGLAGTARLASAGDGRGSFRVRISDAAPDARVDAAGNVIRLPATGGG